MAGLRPVAESMYVDFTPLAMDQIANQGAKNRYMFGGKTRVPMVIRTEGGAGRSIAAHHSQSLEALWAHFPGIYLVMPSTPYSILCSMNITGLSLRMAALSNPLAS